jgi:AraC-like DNA-binding protein
MSLIDDSGEQFFGRRPYEPARMSDLATLYLSERNLSVSQIAWLVGYRGVGAFSHRCKRWTGMNPKRMRDKLLAGH